MTKPTVTPELNMVDNYYDVMCSDFNCEAPVSWALKLSDAEEIVRQHEEWHDKGCPDDWDDYEI